MHPRYDLHSWSVQRPEEILREARAAHLVERAMANHSPRSGEARAGRIREDMLSLLHKARLTR